MRHASITMMFVATVAAVLPGRTPHATGWAESMEPEIEALRKGDVEAAKRYFGGEAKKNIPDEVIVQIALPAALESGSIELMQFLNAKGWLTTCKKAKVCEPVFWVARSNGSVPLIRYLMKEGFSIRFQDTQGQTALHLAAGAGKLSATRFFCEQNVDALASTKSKQTPLDSAVLGMTTRSHLRGEFAEREAVVDFLRGRTCQTESAYPVLASLPSSRSKTIGSSQRVKRLFHGASSLFHYGFFCAQLDSGLLQWSSTFQCWRGEESSTPVASPLPMLGNLRAVQVAFGVNPHKCMLLAGSKVKCWGLNDVGQLGLGDKKTRNATTTGQIEAVPFVDLGPEFKAVEIVTRSRSTCARSEIGMVKCWGLGELGLGDSHPRGGKPGEMGANLPTVDLGWGRKAIQIAGRCVLLEHGLVKCWGSNAFGQLGLGDYHDRGARPSEMGDHLPVVNLGSGVKARQIAAGERHYCALLDNGRVKCWGANYYGQLGLGDARARGDDSDEMGDKLPFVDLGHGLKAVQIVADRDETCALLDNGGVKCWGFKGRGYFAAEMGDNLPYVKFQ